MKYNFNKSFNAHTMAVRFQIRIVTFIVFFCWVGNIYVYIQKPTVAGFIGSNLTGCFVAYNLAMNYFVYKTRHLTEKFMADIHASAKNYIDNQQQQVIDLISLSEHQKEIIKQLREHIEYLESKQ